MSEISQPGGPMTAPLEESGRPVRWRKRIQAAALVLSTLLLAAKHATTSPSDVHVHVIYQELSYLPIIVAAYWFGIVGGATTGVVAAMGTLAHFHSVWAGNEPLVFSQYGQAVGFIIIGAVGGALASAQRVATRKYQQALAELQAANAELRASHEQLLRADRLSQLGAIAAGLAHEVRNPLASVKGSLDIIIGRASEKSPEAEFAALASQEIGRVQKLIEEFLTYARPHEPQRRNVDIVEILDPVVSLLAREAEERGVSIGLERSDGAAAVSVDPEQIAQVFFNIVLNAIQVTPSGGRVSIAAKRHADAALLAIDVQDEGPGIRPDHATKVFEPFFSTKKGGTGLGLAISQRIVHSHGGTIEVMQPARGALVRVTLPLAPAPDTAAGTERSEVTA